MILPLDQKNKHKKQKVNALTPCAAKAEPKPARPTALAGSHHAGRPRRMSGLQLPTQSGGFRGPFGLESPSRTRAGASSAARNTHSEAGQLLQPAAQDEEAIVAAKIAVEAGRDQLAKTNPFYVVHDAFKLLVRARPVHVACRIT